MSNAASFELLLPNLVAEPGTAELNLRRPFLNVAEHHRLLAEPKLVVNKR